MSCNKHQPHVLVLPEDDADSRLATGFHLQVDRNRQRRMQVLPVAGGWNEVLDLFLSIHVREMNRWHQRLMILLIDCDGHANRLDDVRTQIPANLSDRVFVLGTLTEPEDLTPELGSLEAVGAAIANDCRERTNTVWNHDLLRHNVGEVQHLNLLVRTLLFTAA